jgi:hypothetical protein
LNGKRNFIITAGRSGSTLLCSILADAGADFGLPHISGWDPGGGTYEHRLIAQAAKWYRRAHEISPDRPLPPRKWAWTLVRHQGKHLLRRALRQAEFFKALHLDLAVQPASKLGYFPQIVVSFRAFVPQALSLAKMFSERDAGAQEAEYLRTYRNAMMWLFLYGGCVVDYDDLVDPACNRWITPLAAVTGLPATELAYARRARVRQQKFPLRPNGIEYSEATARLEATMRDLCGQLVLPSHIAVRAWNHANGEDGHTAERTLAM